MLTDTGDGQTHSCPMCNARGRMEAQMRKHSMGLFAFASGGWRVERAGFGETDYAYGDTPEAAVAALVERLERKV